MIIRLSLNDNDFIHLLEKFCFGLRDRMFIFDKPMPLIKEFNTLDAYDTATNRWFDDLAAMEEKRRKLLCPDNRFSDDSIEYRQICDEVLRLWTEFQGEADTCEDTCGLTLDVSIQYCLEDKWENGEATYYFSKCNRCITQ